LVPGLTVSAPLVPPSSSECQCAVQLQVEAARPPGHAPLPVVAAPLVPGRPGDRYPQVTCGPGCGGYADGGVPSAQPAGTAMVSLKSGPRHGQGARGTHPGRPEGSSAFAMVHRGSDRATGAGLRRDGDPKMRRASSSGDTGLPSRDSESDGTVQALNYTLPRPPAGAFRPIIRSFRRVGSSCQQQLNSKASDGCRAQGPVSQLLESMDSDVGSEQRVCESPEGSPAQLPPAPVPEPASGTECEEGAHVTRYVGYWDDQGTPRSTGHEGALMSAVSTTVNPKKR
jgi:hypothetical protein